MKRWRAAVVGLGAAGNTSDDPPQPGEPRSHAGAYLAHPRFDLIAVTDPEPRQRERFRQMRMQNGATFPGVILENIAELAGLKCDVVSLCSPTPTHKKMLLSLLDIGVKAIFCEKPLSGKIADSRVMVEACRQAGVSLAVNFQRRWDEGHRYFFSAMVEPPIHIEGRYGKGWLNYGSHMVDLLLAHCGSVSRVQAISTIFNAVAAPNYDPLLDVHLTFECGITAHLGGIGGVQYDLFDLDFYTAHHCYWLRYGGCWKGHDNVVANAFYPGYAHLFPAANPKEEPVRGLTGALSNIAAHLENRSIELASTGTSALAVDIILDSAIVSAQRQTAIKISHED